MRNWAVCVQLNDKLGLLCSTQWESGMSVFNPRREAGMSVSNFNEELLCIVFNSQWETGMSVFNPRREAGMSVSNFIEELLCIVFNSQWETGISVFSPQWETGISVLPVITHLSDTFVAGDIDLYSEMFFRVAQKPLCLSSQWAGGRRIGAI